MGKIRRNNFVFLTWKGDHSPRHVHVYKDSKFVVKYDLENRQVMKGRITRSLLTTIKEPLKMPSVAFLEVPLCFSVHKSSSETRAR